MNLFLWFGQSILRPSNGRPWTLAKYRGFQRTDGDPRRPSLSGVIELPDVLSTANLSGTGPGWGPRDPLPRLPERVHR